METATVLTPGPETGSQIHPELRGYTRPPQESSRGRGHKPQIRSNRPRFAGQFLKKCPVLLCDLPFPASID